MLWTSRGQQVYVGSSASLSFLILLRDTLGKYAGRSTFTDASTSSVMFENRAPSSKGELCCPYTGTEHDDLVDVFYAATCGVLDIMPAKDDLYSVFHTVNDESSTKAALLQAILAVGAQCRSMGMQDRQCEQTHIATARDIAFDALRDDQLDVDLVRAFTVMAFYMFGACRRNTAFMYLGIAARASDALGLHLQSEGIQIWKSVRILDLLVAAVLGRSSATASSEVWHGDHIPTTHRQLALNASFDVWTIIESIVQELYRHGNSDIDQVRTFLDRLSTWSSSLPQMIKSDPPQGLPDIEHKEHVIGNTHVSCAYYYAVIITTRKALITVLHRHLQGGPHTSSRQTLGNELTQLAQACVDSALLLVQTCKEVFEAGMLLDNMCLLKAWIFAAGMIVGYAFFVDPETYTGLEQGLRDACRVLQHLSILSPQAKQYHDILQALQTAAHEHHQRESPLVTEQQTPLVSKIFSLGQPAAIGPAFDTSQSNSTLLSDSLATEDPFSASAGFTPLEFTTEGMESVAAQFWDELLLDRDQFHFT